MTELQRLVRGRIEAAGSVRGAAQALGVDPKTIMAALRGSTSNRKLRRVLGMEEVLCESQATGRVTPAFRDGVEARKLVERARWHAPAERVEAPDETAAERRERAARTEIAAEIAAAKARERRRAGWRRVAAPGSEPRPV